MTPMKFSHLGIAVSNIEKAILIYRDIFGYKLLSGPYHDPVQKVSVCFLGTEIPRDPEIELVAPLGDDSPINRILSSEIGIYHLSYEVEDIDRTLANVRAKGCVVISKPVSAVAFAGRRIAWFYTPTHQLIEVVER